MQVKVQLCEYNIKFTSKERYKLLQSSEED